MDTRDRPTFKDIEKHFEQLVMSKCNDLYITIHDILEFKGVFMCIHVCM